MMCTPMNPMNLLRRIRRRLVPIAVIRERDVCADVSLVESPREFAQSVMRAPVRRQPRPARPSRGDVWSPL